MKIALSNILPSPEPVRTQMEPAKLDELAQSIKEQGLIVPIKVRPANVQTESWVRRVEEAGTDWQRVLGVKDSRPQNEQYEIVYGHRRFAASKMAGLEEIEAIVEGAGDDDALIQALIENVQREDMNDADVRDGILKLREMGMTKREIALSLGWDETRVGQITAINDEEAEIIKTRPSLVSESHVRGIRRSGVAGNERTAILNKAADEELTSKQAESVAKSVAATKDPRRKQQLIDDPYSPYTHDPEYAKERADRFGASDPIARKGHKSSVKDWKDTPEVALLLQRIKDFKELASKAGVMRSEGKFSPEALPFVEGKVKAAYGEWADMFEEWKNE